MKLFERKAINALCAITTIAFSAVLMGGASAEGTSRTPISEVEWNEVPGGRALANVHGDYKEGAHLKLIKFGAGQKTGVHIHSFDYVGIVVQGRARHFEPNNPQTETVLEPGSYWSITAGVPHVSECLEGQDCLFATQSDGPFDAMLVD